jgi:eukaryotic-like serine/threonine-protein kinase
MTPPGATPPAPAAAGRFVPGHVLADRYRMVSWLGTDEQAEVWRADDLVLQSAVALKLRPGDAGTRTRVLNEVRLARQITHPGVCRVFDVGEAEGDVFVSQELVEGEDLGTLLRRVGRLPEEKVFDIGRQLCLGLAAIHAHGVLHRNLKTTSVLIDQDGFIKITDFRLTDTDAAAEHSERDDVYALGLVLYELVAGIPFVTSSPPLRGTDRRLDRALRKCLAANPARRPASAAELLTWLTPADAGSQRFMMLLTGACVAAVLGAVAFVSSTLIAPPSAPLTDRDTILVADFQNTTGEAVFDGALKVALAVALEQSPFLQVFPDDRVRQTLRLMQQPPDRPLTRAIARDVARRERIEALVTGSIASLGSHYVLALEAISAETGDVMAREQVEVASKEQVLTELGTASSRLREKLGESLTTIERFAVPLPQATTASLDALQAYSLALDQGRMNPRPEAIPHLTRALELDPNFAMAQALMSGVHANTGRSGLAPAYSRRAFELRDRVSERERFFISWRYFLDAEQAWDRALDLATSWARTYPREAFAFNSLGLAHAAFGQHDQAITAFREAIRLDPRFVPPHGNLAGSLMALNRTGEAEELLKAAAAQGVEVSNIRRMAYLSAFLRADAAAMQRELDNVRGSTNAMWASSLDARTTAFFGRMRGAHDLFHAAAQSAVRGGFNELGAQWTSEDAELHALVDECDTARREIDASLVLSRDNFTLERASRALALCGHDADATALTDELRRRYASATLSARVQIPVTAAVLALRRRQFDHVIGLLDPVRPYDAAPAAEFWPSYLRGHAYLGLRDHRAAAAEFRTIINRRGAAPTSPLYVLAHLGVARSAVLAGQPNIAKPAFERFFELWAAADAPNVILRDARREYARLE